jgi:sugar O-acyltransferase (sialic acid O-acetyltransferase NeuD family)
MKSIIEILVPQKTVNDVSVYLSDLLVESGERVEKNQIVASMETSKTTFELYSPESGYLFYQCEKGDNLGIGQLFGVISQKPIFPKKLFKDLDERIETDTLHQNIYSKTRFSNKASALIKKQNLDIELFSDLVLVRESDVIRVISLQHNSDKPLPEFSIDPAKPSILLVGGGGLAKMVIDLIRLEDNYHIIGIVDNLLSIGSEVSGVPVIGDDSPETLRKIRSQGVEHVILCVGSTDTHKIRVVIYNRLKAEGYKLPNLIHPTASVELSFTMGEGNLILANATVSSYAKIGNICYINTNAIVSHDCIIDDNVHIAPGGILAGRVIVGSNTIIGMGVTIYIGTQIGNNVIIRNGMNIFNHVEDHAHLK